METRAHRLHRFCRHFFAKKFQHVIQAQLEDSGVVQDVEASLPKPWHESVTSLFRRRHTSRADAPDGDDADRSESSSDVTDPKAPRARRNSLIKKLRTDMIRRMDDAPKLVNPSGWISEGAAPRTPPASPASEHAGPHFGYFPSQPLVMSPPGGEEDGSLPPAHRMQMQPFALPPVSEEGPAPRRTWSVLSCTLHVMRPG